MFISIPFCAYTYLRGYRNCAYPQHFTLQLECPAKLQQLQLLSHEFKIPGKVELQVSNSSPTQQPAFTRLGFLHFDNNERTNFSARELKSITLPNTEVTLLRLVFHRAHPNPLNTHNQVSLITVDVIGVPVAPTTIDSLTVPRLGMLSLNAESAMSVVDAVTAERIDKLQLQKAEAVAREDYDMAKRLKGAIDRLRIAGTKIAGLESKKKEAVEIEDYDTAKALKEEIERARARAYDVAYMFQEQENLDDNAMSNVQLQQQSPQGSGGAMPGVFENSSRASSVADVVPSPVPALGSRAPDRATPHVSSNSEVDREVKKVLRVDADRKDQEDKEVVVDSEMLQDAESPPPPDGFPADLPVPEALKRTETSDALEFVVGEYLARCLTSKTWQLREAALSYLASRWSQVQQPNSISPFEFKVKESDNKAENVKAVAVAISQSIRSRVPGLVAVALRLFRIIVSSAPSCDVPPKQLQSIVFDMIPVMVDRAAEGGPRSREKEHVLETLIHLCNVPECGLKSQQSLANQLLATPSSPPSSHQQSRTKGQTKGAAALPPKAALARIQLVLALLPANFIGVAGCVSGGGGFPPESVLRFAMPGLKSSSAEVRAAAAELTMRVGRTTGAASTVLSALPSDINPKLREQVEAGLGTLTNAGSDKMPGSLHANTTSTNTSASIAAGRKPKLVRAQQGHPAERQLPAPPDSTTLVNTRSPSTNDNHQLPTPSQREEERIFDEASFHDPVPFEEELRERERRYGPRHPAVAEAASNLAIVYNQCGEPGRALPLYRRALEIWETVHGAFHPDVAHTLTDIAVILLEHGRDEDGRALLSRALEIQSELLGEYHPDCVAIRDVLHEMQQQQQQG